MPEITIKNIVLTSHEVLNSLRLPLPMDFTRTEELQAIYSCRCLAFSITINSTKKGGMEK